MDNIHLALVLHDQSGHYSKYVGTTLLSVFENMSVYNHSSICVHIFHDDTLTKENKEKFEELVYGYNNKILFHKILMTDIICHGIDITIIKKNVERITIGALYRLFIPNILKNIEKVIYLDSDVLVNIDIRTLWNEDISEYYAAVVSDDKDMAKMYVDTKYYRNMGIDYRAYFNAGILLLNLKNINLNIDFSKESMKLLSVCTKFSDQDVLNALLKDKVKFIDKKYNLLIDLQKGSDEKLAKQIKTKAVLHFAGYLKPWNCNNSDVIKLYCSYLIKTPWIRMQNDLIECLSFAAEENYQKINLKNSLLYKEKDGSFEIFTMLLLKAILSNDVFYRIQKKLRYSKIQFLYNYIYKNS